MSVEKIVPARTRRLIAAGHPTPCERGLQRIAVLVGSPRLLRLRDRSIDRRVRLGHYRNGRIRVIDRVINGE